MNISFTGIRNASFVVDKDDHCKYNKFRYFNTQLTDDALGNDLSEYKKLIKKFPDLQNPYYSNFVNIGHCKTFDTDIFALNGKLIPEHDKFLPVFSFIGKLSDKVSKMPEDSFIHDRKYLISDYADKALLLDKKLSEEMNKPFAEIVEDMHNPKGIKLCAKNIVRSLRRCMMEYLK